MRHPGSRPLRIAVWHNLPSGGGKRALYDHISGLQKRGHEVVAWCPPSADQDYLPLNSLCPEHVMPLSEAKALSRFTWLPLLRAYLLLRARLAAMDRHCRACAEAINAGCFDVLFANACMFFRATSIARYLRIPSVLYLGEPYRWLYEALPNPPWAALPTPPSGRWTPKNLWLSGKDLVTKQADRLQVREEVANAAAFDRILVNSLYSRESILRAYGLDSKVCYLGIDLERFRPTGEQKQGFVIGLGGLYVGKGTDRAIRAIATIEPRQRPRFIWVGNFANQQYSTEIERLAQALGVVFEVRVGVADQELVSLLSRANALIYTPRLEPFGLAPLEANACGTTVVAIAEGGVRETIEHGHNGVLVKDDNPIELGRLIAELTSSPQLAADRGLRARRHVEERWKLDHGIDEIERQLHEIAKHRQPQPRI